MEGDDPMTEHSHLFPLCPFVLGYEVGNTPLGPDEHIAGDMAQVLGQDETGIRWSEQHREPNSAAENVSVLERLLIRTMIINFRFRLYLVRSWES